MTWGRVDLNQKEIVEALRAAGVSVLVTSQIGRGFPDLIAAVPGGPPVLIEVKNPKNSYGRKGLNKRQQSWVAAWKGAPPVVVTTAEEALAAVGLLPQDHRE